MISDQFLAIPRPGMNETVFAGMIPPQEELPVIVAAIQMNSGTNSEENRSRASHLIEQAVSAGAELVSLPESFAWLGPDGEKAEHGESIPGPSSRFLSELATRHSALVHGGSFFESGPDDGSCYNSTLLIRADGKISARYRKIHLFDAVVDGERYLESDTVRAGDTPVVVEERGIRFGLSVCYDLRFPELYRTLADEGAHAVFVPAAFTRTTGRAHWEILLRARAVENQVYVIAAAQVGRGADGREWFGHSMIVDPWGEILAEADGEHEGVITARLDLENLSRIRDRLPVLHHRRFASGNLLPTVSGGRPSLRQRDVETDPVGNPNDRRV